MSWIPCQHCGKELPTNWSWFVCDRCGFRVCPSCLSKHSGRYSTGDPKCSKCISGVLRPTH